MTDSLLIGRTSQARGQKEMMELKINQISWCLEKPLGLIWQQIKFQIHQMLI